MSSTFPRTTSPLVIEDSNLSRVWARALVYVLDHPGTEIAPLLVSVTGFDASGIVPEEGAIRGALDSLLTGTGDWDVETVAFTIFPQRYWLLARGNRAELFKIYRDAFPRLQAMNRRSNGRGLYFERLTMYGRGPCDGNQLEWILSQYHSRDGIRRSMLQATTFDPGRDHVPDAQLRFPCLQQVSFEPTAAGLIVNAFYATQQLFVKAYGNYLGLARLGLFMAAEMGMTLARLNVFIGIAKLEGITKSDAGLLSLIAISRVCISETSDAGLATSVPTHFS